MKFRLIIFLTALALCNAYHAEAQFWKNWFHKDERRHYTPRRPKQQNNTTTETKTKETKKKKEIEYPVTQMKARYRIDVLAPLYLDELVKNDKVTFKSKIPDKALPTLEFCEGLKIAADSLSNLYNVDIYIHDITSDKDAPETLVKSGRLDSSDLIIGAVTSRDIPVIATFAKKKKINFISAFSPSDGGVKNNQFFTQLQPSLHTHCEALMKLISKKYTGKNVMLFHRTSVGVDANAYDYFTSADTARTFQKVLCNEMPTQEKLRKLFDSNTVNVIVMTILDYNVADAFLKELYTSFPNYTFEVYGMPTWRSMGSIHKADAYPNVTVYITEPFYFDVSVAEGQYLAGMYKKEYGSSRPTEYVYQGYETIFWYMGLLSRYGTIFNKNIKDNSQAPFTKFEIIPEWNKEKDYLYSENTHVCVYKFQSGSYIVQQ